MSISAVTSDAAGRVISWIEDDYLFSVVRDAAGRPVQIRANSPGRKQMNAEFKYTGVGDRFSGIAGIISTAMLPELMADANAAGGPTRERSFADFISSMSETADHTSAFALAAAASASDGFDVRLPPGTFNYEGRLTGWSRSIRGAGRSASKVVQRLNPTTNLTYFADFSGVNGIEVSGIEFSMPLTPSDAVNDADNEARGFMRFSLSTNITVKEVDFIGGYGTALMLRSIVGGRVLSCRTVGERKDSFHVTGLSQNITRQNCEVIDGGDDGFPVVGYAGGPGTLGQPVNIRDIGNHVRGVRFARGFAYVGARDVVNVGCTVEGTVPAEYSPAAGQAVSAGLYIASEGSFNTHGNENIRVYGMTIDGCGTSSASIASVHITGRAAQPSRDITLRDMVVKNGARQSFFANGGAAGGLSNVRLENFRSDTNTDPNGRIGSAGAGNANAVEFQNTDGVYFRGSVKESGAYGVVATANCTGTIDIKVETENINKSGTAGVDLVNIATGSAASEIMVDLTIKAQPNVSSAGTAYYTDRAIECANAGNVRSVRVRGAQLDRRAVLGNASGLDQTITVTGSPFLYTNTTNAPQIVRVTGGTVSAIAAGMTTGIASPLYTTITGRTGGLFMVEPGCSLRVTYTVAPTMTWVPTSC